MKLKNFHSYFKRKPYFIADIAANHDGSIVRAKKLIRLAAKNGADAAKFQNFFADTIVSDKGFKDLKKGLSHQSKWKKSVYNVYKAAELPLKWTIELKKECKKNNIEYFTAPYDEGIINYLNNHLNFWKIGSGDITWHENVLKMAKTKKPIMIATGASNLNEVVDIVKKVEKINKKIIIMQCNTNYTADDKNFNFINLKVLNEFRKLFPKYILGLSDHTFGSETVLGAIALGATVIEKHFTDDNSREGPDHKFSMNPIEWNKMIVSSNKLFLSLGDGKKKIENNEKATSIIQRRSIRIKKDLKKGSIIKKEDLICLRPCPIDAAAPYEINKFIGKKINKNLKKHDYLKWSLIKK